jgi:anti-anti-sigma regulatory factor
VAVEGEMRIWKRKPAKPKVEVMEREDIVMFFCIPRGGKEEANELAKATDAAFVAGGSRFIIDLCNLRHDDIDKLVGVLINIHMNCQKRGGRAVLSRISKFCHISINILKLYAVFEVYASVDEAVASFRVTE